MSQENVEIVRRSFEAFNQGGIEAVIGGDFWSPDVVLDLSPTGIPGLGVYRGYHEIKTFFEEDWFRAFPFEEWKVEIAGLTDHGDQIVFMSLQRGRGASSGAAAQLELGNVFTLRDGEVVRMEVHPDREKALEAAGLRE
jgi:ketosteroid isomerase-like protein